MKTSDDRIAEREALLKAIRERAMRLAPNTPFPMDIKPLVANPIWRGTILALEDGDDDEVVN